MLVRYTPARTTSSKLLPAALRTAERFWKTRSVSAAIPPVTSLPVAGSWPTCPLKKRKPSILTAWENGPTGGASSGEVIAVLLIATPVATSVADQSPQTQCSIAGQPTFSKFIIFTITISFKDKFTSHFSAQNFSDLIPVHSGLVLTRAITDYLFGHCFKRGGLIADVPGISRHVFISDLEIHIGLIRRFWR